MFVWRLHVHGSGPTNPTDTSLSAKNVVFGCFSTSSLSLLPSLLAQGSLSREAPREQRRSWSKSSLLSPRVHLIFFLQLSSSRLWGQLLAWHLVQVYLRESSNRITEKKNIENAMYERKVFSSNIPHHQWSPASPCWSPCASLWGSPVSPPGNDNLIGSHAPQRVQQKLKIRTLKKCNHLQITRAPVAVHHCVWFWGMLIWTPGLMWKYWRRRYK